VGLLAAIDSIAPKLRDHARLPFAGAFVESTLQVPSLLRYGELRLHPFWDPLRGDPRFEKLVEESKKPVALK
jgi:hypothetical protein